MIEALRNPKDEQCIKAAKAFEHNFLSDIKLQLSDIYELLLSQFESNEIIIKFGDTIASQQKTIEVQADENRINAETINLLVQHQRILKDKRRDAVKEKWIEVLVGLKQSYSRVASGDISEENIKQLNFIRNEFITFFEGYKSIIRGYPSSERIVNSFNNLLSISSLYNNSQTSIETLKNAVSDWLGILDDSIGELMAD